MRVPHVWSSMVIAIALCGPAIAQTPSAGELSAAQKEALTAAADPVTEKHMREIAEILRCLVCQNQTIADSQADLAIDLRNQIREKLKQGWSRQQILDFMVQRYGDFVLYRPPMQSNTAALWAGPFVLLLTACVIAALYIRGKRRAAQSEGSLSETERTAAQRLLQQTDDEAA